MDASSLKAYLLSIIVNLWQPKSMGLTVKLTVKAVGFKQKNILVPTLVLRVNRGSSSSRARNSLYELRALLELDDALFRLRRST